MALLHGCLMASAFLFSQDNEIKPVRFDGSEWYTINYIDFKSGASGALVVSDDKQIVRKEPG